MKKFIWIPLTCFCFFRSFGQERSWWKETVVYQIYPQSFKDSNGDGVGDFKGIQQKLDYLQRLGVGTIWINPFYKSPGRDNGYDISDFYSINPVYGTMADFDALVSEIKKRKMHLIIDMVLNHTSDEHPWFKAAAASGSSVFHDYYIWKQGKKDSLPNNWPSIFGGSAWKWNEQTKEYYMHTFLDSQPDLNWDNPKLRRELYKVMRFWLDKGVNGFRLDAISVISKNKQFPPMDYSKGILVALNGNINNGPHLHEYLNEMNRQVLSKYDAYAAGEVYTDKDSAWKFVAPQRNELSAILFFDVLRISDTNQARQLKGILDGWNEALQSRNSWNTSVLSNHDFPRALSRIGNDKQFRTQSAKLLATILLTYRGTPFIFEGDELGMTNYPFKNMSEVKDAAALTQFAALKSQQGLNDSTAFQIIKTTTRDNARTPMQWNSTRNAGFTSADRPWLGVNPNYLEINAAEQTADTGSVFNYYWKLISLRKRNPSLVYGALKDITPNDPSVYAYTRSLGNEQWLIILNMTDKVTEFRSEKSGALILSNYPPAGTGSTPSSLKPYEARVYKLNK